METYPLTQIEIEPRIRSAMEEAKVLELADSIHRLGLQHPPVAKRENGKLILVAGERRLRAVTKLHEKGLTISFMGKPVLPGHIPLSHYEDLDSTVALEIELEENLQREDLSWQDVALATARLHALRKEENPTQTITQTAAEVSTIRGTQVSTTQTSNRLILAEHLQRPEVAGAKSERDALKVLHSTLERELRTALGEQYKAGGLAKGKHRAELIDADTGMKRCPDEFFDLILTDPPYGINAEDFQVESVVNKHKYGDDWDATRVLLRLFFKEAFRVTKFKAHLYMFLDVRHFVELRDIAGEYGWDPWPRPLIWVKDTGHIPRPHHGPRRVYEAILYCLKGDRAVNNLQDDVIIVPNEKERLHAAQKPVDLYRNLLSRSVYPGCIVLDPFCGSGTIFPAASALDCSAVGFDNDPAAIAMCLERLKVL